MNRQDCGVDRGSPAQGDVFDRIMRLPLLNRLEPFYRAHREVLLYLLFGGLTFVISVASYALFVRVLRMDALIANVISWVLAVSFAYVTNRTWVFGSGAVGRESVLKEMGKFFSGRIATLLVEEAILLVFIKWLHFDGMAVKVVAQVIVILLNYVISKLWVF